MKCKPIPDGLAALTKLDQWVNWHADKRPTPGINGTLLSYEEACRRDRDRIGFRLMESDPFVCIDIDDPTTELAQWLIGKAKEIGAYIEDSPSGGGKCHIWFKAKLARNIGKGTVDPGVEVYAHAHYMTVTGKNASGSAEVDGQSIVERLWTLHQGERTSPGGSGTQWDAERHQGALDVLDPNMKYPQWNEIGMMLHAGGAPIEVWDEWSSKATGLGSDGKPKYKGLADLEPHWRSFRADGGKTLATLEWMARETGKWPVADEFPDLSAESAGVDYEEQGRRFYRELYDEEAPSLFVSGAALMALAKPLAWAIKGLLPRGCINYLGGAPHVGKSATGLDWGLCIAAGIDWHGRRTYQATVFYIAQEGRNGVPLRCQAWAQKHGIDPATLPFSMSHTWVSLLDEGGVAELARDVRRAKGHAVVLVDTQAASTPGGDEGVEEISALLNRLQTGVVEPHGATVVMLAHTPLSDPWRLRGSGAQKGGAEAVVMMGKSEDYQGLVEMRPDKLRDEALAEPMYFKPERVLLNCPGTGEPMLDEDGDRVSAVYLELVDPTTRVPTLLDEVLRFIADRPGASKTEIREGVAGASAKKDAALAQGIRDGLVRRETGGRGHAHHLTTAGREMILGFDDLDACLPASP